MQDLRQGLHPLVPLEAPPEVLIVLIERDRYHELQGVRSCLLSAGQPAIAFEAAFGYTGG